MNFLAHSMISYEIDKKIVSNGTLFGNFIGDYKKGKIETLKLPKYIERGVILHRIIDKISDREENFLYEILKDKFGIYKGIVSDMYIDHFLSKNFNRIFQENINEIERKIMYSIEENKKNFPKDFEYFFEWLKNEEILKKYSNIKVLEKVFYGISKRVKNGEILNNAARYLLENYDIFEEKSINEFEYVKKESIKKYSEMEKK